MIYDTITRQGNDRGRYTMRPEKKQRFTPVTDREHRCGDITYHSFRGTTVYIIHGKNGDMMIDTGLFHVRRAVRKWAKRYNVKYIFITHAHADHDWNAARFRKDFGARLLLNKKDFGLRSNYKPMKATRPKYRLKCFQLNINGRLFPSPRYKVDIPIKGEGSALLERLGFDGQFVFLPGHTEGMTALLQGDTLYCGDAFTALFYEAEIPPYAGDIGVMKKSLKRILEINPKWLACGHGIPVKMEDARKVIKEYIGRGR